MAAVEPLGSYDSEMHTDGSRINVVRLVDLLGPISPELVLVDPQLAAHARALLPDVSFTQPPRQRERASSASSPASPTPSRRTIPWRLVGACAVFIAAVSTGFGAWTTVAGQDAGRSPEPPDASGPTFFSTPPTEPDLSLDAIAALEAAARREPLSPLAREALGTAYFRLGRWEDAEAEFLSLVDLSPSDDFAYYALGRTLAKQGRQWEAARQFKLAGSLSDGGISSAETP
jgi:tetratricopeptide (TPR) repeat protein